MGNIECCGERPEHRAKTLLQNLPSQHQVTANVDDLVAFDRALKANDVRALVSLLKSQSPFKVAGSLSEMMGHPWAEPPECVAALAATQLAAMASTDDSDLRKEIIDAGGVPEFYRMTQLEDAQDQREAALVALNFVTYSDTTQSAGAEELLKLHPIPSLIKLIMPYKSVLPEVNLGAASINERPRGGKIQARLAAAQICRNLYFDSADLRQEFLRAGGITAMLTLLQQIGSETDTRLECLYLLEDFINAPCTDELRKAVADTKDMQSTLEANCGLDDEEVVTTCRDLLTNLYSVKEA